MKLRIFFIAFLDEIEGYDRRVEELGAQKEKKMENLKGRNEYLEEEYERVMTIIDDMECRAIFSYYSHFNCLF